MGGRTGFEENSTGRFDCTWRDGEFPVEGRVFCRRFGDGFSGSGVPKEKVPEPPKLIRREEKRCAEFVSLDDDVERDQRFRFATPSVLGRRRKSGEVTN